MVFKYMIANDLQGKYRWWGESYSGDNLWNGQFDIINEEEFSKRVEACKVLAIRVEEHLD